jgi:hypothetical protein
MKPYLTLTLLALAALSIRAAEPMKADAPKATVKPAPKAGELKPIPELDWLHLENAALKASELEKSPGVVAYRDAMTKQNEAYSKVCADAGISDLSKCGINPPDPKDTKQTSGLVFLRADPPKADAKQEPAKK